MSTRMLLSYSIPLICLMGLGVSAHIGAQRTFELETQRDLIKNSERKANDASYHLVDSIRRIKAYILEPDKVRYVAAYNASHQLFLEDVSRLSELAAQQQDPQLQALATELSEEGENIDRAAQRIIEQVERRSTETAIAQTTSIEAARVGDRRNRLVAHLEQQISDNTAQFTVAQQRLSQTLLWGTGLAASTSMALGFLLTYQIRRQMKKIVGVVEHNGIQVTASSNQISASSRQLEANITEQATSTTEITATAAAIAATAEELTQTMEQVANRSEAAATTASDGQRSLEQMEATLQQLISATATISAKLGLIDSKANNIGAVVTAITKVADRTNLLSLNAAIEAEKAGEYGAGFSVVAREIRRLADRTAIATLEIENMVQEMLASVSAGVMEMDKFTQDVSHNASSITQISAQMAQIIEQVQGLVPQFETVSAGMQAQSQGAQQIRQAMEQLNDSSQQTAESVKDANQAIGQLGDVARDLQSEVAHFRLAV